MPNEGNRRFVFQFLSKPPESRSIEEVAVIANYLRAYF
jgi:hypothetical protein